MKPKKTSLTKFAKLVVKLAARKIEEKRLPETSAVQYLADICYLTKKTAQGRMIDDKWSLIDLEAMAQEFQSDEFISAVSERLKEKAAR